MFKLKLIIILFLIMNVIPIISSSTTFFDNPQDFRIFSEIPQGGYVIKKPLEKIFYTNNTLSPTAINFSEIDFVPIIWSMGYRVDIFIKTFDKDMNPVDVQSLEFDYPKVINENRNNFDDKIRRIDIGRYSAQTFLRDGNYTGAYNITVKARQGSLIIERIFKINVIDRPEEEEMNKFISIIVFCILVILFIFLIIFCSTR